MPAKVGLDFDLTELSFGIFGFLLVIMMVLRPEGLLPERRRKLEMAGIGAGDTAGVGGGARGLLRGQGMSDETQVASRRSRPSSTRAPSSRRCRSTKAFGGLTAVDDVDFDDPGAVDRLDHRARTARARPRSSTCSPASTGRPQGASTSRAATSPTCVRTGSSRAGWRGRSRTSACSRRCRRSRTCSSASTRACARASSVRSRARPACAGRSARRARRRARSSSTSACGRRASTRWP